MSLRTVFNNIQLIFFCHIHNRFHITGLSIKMHGYYGFGMIIHRRFNQFWIYVKSSDIRLNKHWCRTYIGNSQRCSNISIRWNNDLVTLTDAHRLQCKHKCIKAIANANTIFNSTILRKCFFEYFIFNTADVPGACEHPFKCPSKVIA